MIGRVQDVKHSENFNVRFSQAHTSDFLLYDVSDWEINIVCPLPHVTTIHNCIQRQSVKKTFCNCYIIFICIALDSISTTSQNIFTCFSFYCLKNMIAHPAQYQTPLLFRVLTHQLWCECDNNTSSTCCYQSNTYLCEERNCWFVFVMLIRSDLFFLLKLYLLSKLCNTMVQNVQQFIFKVFYFWFVFPLCI